MATQSGTFLKHVQHIDAIKSNLKHIFNHLLQLSPPKSTTKGRRKGMETNAGFKRRGKGKRCVFEELSSRWRENHFLLFLGFEFLF